MRNLALVVLLLVVALALPFGSAAADSEQPRPVPPQYIAPATAADVLNAFTPEGWIDRHSDLLITEKLEGVVVAKASVRTVPFTDALDNRAVRITEDAEGEGLLVCLERPALTKGGQGEKWVPKKHLITPRTGIKVRFSYEGVITSTLPEDFVLRPAAARSSMKDGVDYYLSADDIVASSGVFGSRKGCSLFSEKFSDAKGGAARLRKTEGIVEMDWDEVTAGFDPKQVTTEELDPITTHYEKRKKIESLPARLDRFPMKTAGGKWITGVGKRGKRPVLYVSCEYVHLYLDRQKQPWFDLKPGAIGSLSPFRDRYGASCKVLVINEDPQHFAFVLDPGTEEGVWAWYLDEKSAAEVQQSVASKK